MDILGKLFSSVPLIKIMRLFLMNPEEGFETGDIVKRSQVKESSARTELNLLKSVGFVKRKTFQKEIERKNKKGEMTVYKKKVNGWFLDEDFRYKKQLSSLLIGTDLIDKKDLPKRIRKAGRVKLLVVSGVLIKDDISKIDLLLVGDNIKPRALENIVKTLESEVGRELNYALFTTDEFKYRTSMYDKLICDIFDFPHEILVSSPELSTDGISRR